MSFVSQLRRRVAAAALVCLGQAASPSVAHGQAWVPPKGAGTVSLSTQVIDNTGHRLSDGFLLDDGKSTTVGVYVEGEYALTDRLSFSLGLPYVFARYIGPNPTPANLPVDQCKCWHGGWQDVGGAVRFNVVNRPTFAVTPSVAFGVPSHNYNYQGEAVVGFGLNEARIAVDAGLRLDFITPRLSVQAKYSYAFVERVLDISHDRSNIATSGAYQANRRFSVGGVVAWQRTHGGLRFGSSTGNPFFPPGEFASPDLFGQHDRLLRDNNWRLGANAAYSFAGFDVFGSFLRYMGGTDTHAGHAVTVGLSWPFGV